MLLNSCSDVISHFVQVNGPSTERKKIEYRKSLTRACPCVRARAQANNWPSLVDRKSECIWQAWHQMIHYDGQTMPEIEPRWRRRIMMNDGNEREKETPDCEIKKQWHQNNTSMLGRIAMTLNPFDSITWLKANAVAKKYLFFFYRTARI